ncbi:hypothetical protein F2Q69_00033085 [Brassica cretica]|uniref:DUF1985 domain-containing protein n=1 Tax=Brassica cretica TaxID=69181 RepID=A0A8S9SMV1_BRACR|nr:hypothetical protein F2Q69_00033085 [Brassica cretica]
MLGVHVEAGPSTQEIIAALERCKGWSRDDRKRLAQTKKMEMPELPRMIYTLGEEPPVVHSISYHTCWTLHAALKKALHDDEYEEPKESKLGELTSFWEMLRVHVEAGPSTQEIIAALERCEGWSRDDRKRLAYLAIFTGYIEGRKYSTPIRVSLARLVMELERFENYPWGRVAFKVLMDSVKGRDISGCYSMILSKV